MIAAAHPARSFPETCAGRSAESAWRKIGIWQMCEMPLRAVIPGILLRAWRVMGAGWLRFAWAAVAVFAALFVSFVGFNQNADAAS